jgi:hypothetical protein
MGSSSAGKRLGRGACALALIAAAAIGGCRRAPVAVTGLHLVAHWSDVSVDQLELTITNYKGDPLVERQRRPDSPRELATGADLVVYFADSLAGTPVTCDVKALFQDKVVASAKISPKLKGKTVIDAVADLVPMLGSKVDGSTCMVADECESHFCVDGFCCQTDCAGTCRSCAVPGKQGTCTLVPEGVKHPDCADQGAETCGYDGTCDGLGACRRHPSGTRCAAGTCTGNSVTASGACDGNGNCVMGPVVTCAPFGCDPSGPAAHCFSTCTGPSQCVPGRECVNNSCGKKLPGATCTDSVECASAFCVDGVCCDSKCDGPCLSCGQVGSPGVCRPVPSGVKDPRNICADEGAPTCGTSGSCDGAGGCARYAAGTICKPPSCMSPAVEVTAARCDGLGKCLDGGPLACQPFACSSTTGACNGTCSRNEDCAPGIVCMVSARSCGKKGLGQPCQSGSDCASTFCVDKVCCQDSCQGPCRSCSLGSIPGVCTLALAGAPDPRGACKDMGKASCGTDGACNGNGACRRYEPGTQCAPGTCSSVTNVRTLPSVCDSKGSCSPGTTTACSPYRCNGSTCFAGCGSDADCVPPNTCLGGTCGQGGSGDACSKPADCAAPLTCIGSTCQLIQLGQTCANNSQCRSGHCTDGVCCESGSCGTCSSCKVSGFLGLCHQLAAGSTSAACMATAATTCGHDGTCDGAGNCRFHPAGTQCAAASCNGKDRMKPRTCDGNGTCLDTGVTDCAPFTCNTATNDCFRSCVGDMQCCCGNRCLGGNTCR